MSIDAQLWRVYSSVAMRFLAEWESDSYAIITACNPRSRKLSNNENCIKNRELELDLADFYFASVNVGDPSFEWVEASFAVDLLGGPFRQDVQKYHARSLQSLRNRHRALRDHEALNAILERCDCLRWLATAS